MAGTADPGHAPVVARAGAAGPGLDRRWQLVGDGVTAGSVSMAQAEVIVRALEALDALDVGERLNRELLRRAEQHLVEKAADFTPRRCGPWASGSWR